MINPMCLSGKRILIYNASTGIDKILIRQIENLEGVVYSYNQYDINLLECELINVINSFGPFDGFVFSLTHSDFRPLQYVKTEIVNKLFNDNFGLFIEAIRVLIKNRGLKNYASVIALSSISSIKGMKAKLVFCSAKAALDAAIRCLAIELAKTNIRVNSIQKGFVDTDFEKNHIQNIVTINEGAEEKRTLLGVSKAIEIANLITFLLSDATMTITGSSIVIDGGYTV